MIFYFYLYEREYIIMRSYINGKEIMENYGVSKEELLEMPLGKIFSLMDEIKKKEDNIKYEKDLEKYPLEVKINYFRDYDLFKDIFGEKTINEILSRIMFDEMVQEQWFKEKDSYFTKGRILKESGYHEFDKYLNVNSLYKKKETAYGYNYYIPSQYQGLLHSRIIKEALEKLMPEFVKEFKFDAYEIYNQHADIYVKTNNEKFSIYVPLKALMNRDIDTIKKHNEKLNAEGYKETENDKIVLAFYEYLNKK